MLGQMIFVGHTDKAQTALERYEKGVRARNAFFQEIKNPLLPPHEIKKVVLDGIPILEQTYGLGLDGKGLPNNFLETMFGPDGKWMLSLAAADDQLVVFRFSPAGGLKDIVQAYRQKTPGLAGDRQVRQVADLLPKDAQWQMYMSLRGYSDYMNWASKALGFPLDFPIFPNTPPLGMTGKISEAGLEIHALIPAGVLENLPEYVKKIQKLEEK